MAPGYGREGAESDRIKEYIRCRKLFDDVYSNEIKEYEDVLVAYGQNEIARFDKVVLFVLETDDRGIMNVSLESKGSYLEYSARLNGKSVERWKLVEGVPQLGPADPAETDIVWSVIRKIANTG